MYYSAAARTLVSYEFDRHGVRETEAETLWRALGDAGSWVDAHEDDLDWVHPRYEWATTLDEEKTWEYGEATF
ncbi:MAG: hypothetical protein ABEJ79_07830 [Halolamina sp.]